LTFDVGVPEPTSLGLIVMESFAGLCRRNQLREPSQRI
jgi:hypothetical protein